VRLGAATALSPPEGCKYLSRWDLATMTACQTAASALRCPAMTGGTGCQCNFGGNEWVSAGDHRRPGPSARVHGSVSLSQWAVMSHGRAIRRIDDRYVARFANMSQATAHGCDETSLEPNPRTGREFGHGRANTVSYVAWKRDTSHGGVFRRRGGVTGPVRRNKGSTVGGLALLVSHTCTLTRSAEFRRPGSF
jgi:hypothetical protein